jgi:ribonuclease III
MLMINNISKEQITSIEKALNYQFTNSELLIEALTHPSMKQRDNSVRDYERLEFLGDSILGFLVTKIIFTYYTECEEGNLAKIKAHVVSCSTLVKIANSLNLADYIIMTPGEENSGGRKNPNNIENSLEALIAAIYLDSDIEKTSKIVTNLWQKHISNINLSEADPKTYLQELLQKEKLDAPKYELVDQKGPIHEPIFTIKVSSNNEFKIGKGKSRKEAEKNAARQLLKILKSSKNNV